MDHFQVKSPQDSCYTCAPAHSARTGKKSFLPAWSADVYSRYAAPFYDLATRITGWQSHLSVYALEGLSPCRLLDVGCGTAALLLAAADAGFDATGIDPSGGMLSKAKNKQERLGAAASEAQFVQASATGLPFRTGSFDVVLATGSLVHVPAADRAASEMLRVCREGGLIRVIDHAVPIEREALTPLVSVFSQLSGDILHDYPALFAPGGELKRRDAIGRAGYLQRYDFIKRDEPMAAGS